MLHVFEVYLTPVADPEALLSEESRRESGAQVMTYAEAQAVGFAGLPAPAEGKVLRLVAVAPRDAQWVHRQLESNPDVTSYRVHEVG